MNAGSLDQLVDARVLSLIRQGVLLPGPNAPVAPLPNQRLGVTDGSTAGPGEVGQFINNTVEFRTQGYPNVTQVNLLALTVPAGDWDLWSAFTFLSTPPANWDCAGVGWWLDPVPAGVSGEMRTFLSVRLKSDAALAKLEGLIGQPINCAMYLWLPGQIVRGNFRVPTQLWFTVQVDQSTQPEFGPNDVLLQVSGRRRR